MRALFLTSPNDDGLADQVFNGLLKIGIDVVDYPLKPFYHCTFKNGKIRTFDPVLNDEVVEDENGFVKLSTGERSHRKLLSFSKPTKTQVNPIWIDDFDFCVVGVLNSDNRKIIEKILKNMKYPIYYLDGRDDPFLSHYIMRNIIYYKRELYAGHDSMIQKAKSLGRLGLSYYNRMDKNIRISKKYSALNMVSPKSLKHKVFPINLTVNEHEFPKYTGEKEYDFSFVGSSNNEYRIKMSLMLSKFAKENGFNAFFNIRSKGFKKTDALSWTEYVKIVQKSKISISLPGLGFDTFRYWEIPFYGSCLLSPQLPIKIPNNFRDMESAIFYKNLSDLKHKIIYVLRNDSWKSIAKAGNEYFFKSHTSKDRASTIVDDFNSH